MLISGYFAGFFVFAGFCPLISARMTMVHSDVNASAKWQGDRCSRFFYCPKFREVFGIYQYRKVERRMMKYKKKFFDTPFRRGAVVKGNVRTRKKGGNYRPFPKVMRPYRRSVERKEC